MKWNHIQIPVKVVPASRPFVVNKRAFNRTTYENFKNFLIKYFKMQYINRKSEMYSEDPIMITMTFTVKRPKTSVRYYPRFDVDNAMKSILDAMTEARIFWRDDDQIVVANVVKQFGMENNCDIQWTSL